MDLEVSQPAAPTLDSIFESDAKRGAFVYKEVRSSVPRGEYNEFYGTYCTMVARGEPVDVSQIVPEAATLVLGYEGVLDKSKSIELCERIQRAVASEYIVDALSDNYLGCVITVGNEVSYVYMPQVKVVVHEFNTLHFHNMIPDLDEGIFNPMEDEVFPMYGSDDQKYLCCVVDMTLDTPDTPDQYLEDLNVHDKIFHTKIENDIIKATMFKDYEYEGMPETMWLPMILSPDYWRSITRALDKSEAVRQATRTRRRKYPNLNEFINVVPIVDQEWTTDDYIMFLDMWKPDRLYDPVYWKEVGKAFRTMFTSDPRRGLTAWIRYLQDNWTNSRKNVSNLHPSVVRRACTNAYRFLSNTGVDIKTLAWYARIDSPEKYYAWHDKWFTEAFKSSFRNTHRDVAKAAYRLYWLDIIAVKGDKSDIFYKFQNHCIRRDHGFAHVRWLLNNDFLLQYNRFRSDIADAGRDTAIGQEYAKNVYGLIDRVVDSLGNFGFKSRVIGEMADMFHVDGLENFMDQDKELTLLKNGVFVVADGDLHFRDGKPQDYLSTSFGGYYREDYTWDHPDILNAMEWATITFVDPETVTFFWKYFASMYMGGNQDKKLVFFTGSKGNNMKTTWQNMIGLVLGERCIMMPINYYTMGKGKADSAAPAEIRLASGIRLMISEEPDPSAPILTSQAKAITGNGKIWTRGNYQDGREFVPQVKPLIVTNDVPPTHKEPAMEERVLILPFESQMVYGAPATREEQFKARLFPRDPDFDSKLPGMVDGITWINKQFFKVWHSERLKNPPADVVKITKNYWDSVDRFSSFFRDYIIEDQTDSIDSIDLYNKFHKWHGTTYKKLDVPEKDKMVAALSKKFGSEPLNGLWHGYGFRVSQNNTSLRQNK